jgi:hypothetical protein
MDAERDILTRMLSGTRSSRSRRRSSDVSTAASARESAVIQLVSAVSQFTDRTLPAVRAARDDCRSDEPPGHELVSIAAIDVGAACLALMRALRPGLLSAEDVEMLMVQLREQRTIKAPPAGELHDRATVLRTWAGDVVRQIHDASELMLSSDMPDLVLAPLERAVASCVDVALLGGLLAPSAQQ